MRYLKSGLLPVIWMLLCSMEYPPTARNPVIDVYHGVKLVDPYRWFETPDDQVSSWLEAQDSLTVSILDQLPQRQYLTERFNALWRYDDATTPQNVVEGDRLFWYTKAATDEKWIYRTKLTAASESEILLNPNYWGEDSALSYVLPSRDGSYIAYGRTQGDEDTVSYVMEVATKKILPDTLRGSRQQIICWMPENKGFYYWAHPKKGELPEGEEFYWHATYYHELGTPSAQDRKVMAHDTIKEYYHSVYLSEDARYRFYYRFHQGKTEVSIQAVASNEPPIPIAEGFTAAYSTTVLNDRLFILTNENAPKYKVFVTSVLKPQREHWQEFLPESNDKLAFFEGVADRIYTIYEHNAYSQVKIYSLEGKLLRELKLPEIGTTRVSGYWSRPEVWVHFSSFTRPDEDYLYDFESNQLNLYRKSPIAVDTSSMTTEQVWYPSKDETSISMFILHRTDLPRTADQPMLLTGYGGFNYRMIPNFSSLYYVWLEVGGSVAIPNLRGGGEYGEEWYNAGKLDKKQNVFDDFIAAAEWLISQGYTKPEKLAISGSSNGGLLMGAVAMQRPDLFKAVLCINPLLDMIRYHLFTYANIWAGEYGTADDPKQFQYLLDYSPYHNIKYGRVYPAMLLKASEQDIRTPVFHAAKMAARLQEANAGGPPILFLLERASGHTGSSTTSAAIDLNARLWAFLMDQIGLPGPSSTTQNVSLEE